MAVPSVSVVIVSRDRPDALMRCIDGVAQLFYSPFEVVVVACARGSAAAEARADAAHLKIVLFEAANISAARNAGVSASAGEVVAFIDDDAVPEPTWLAHLVAPFADSEVAVAGGYVLGRNGISFQWRARSVDVGAMATELPVTGSDPVILHPMPGRAIKTEGTNMALRREVLAEMGGFDPAFHFYLDETDLNMRLARAGHATAIVPLAQVHHGFAPSARRDAERVPRDLREIGASMAVYLRKHCPAAHHANHWARHRETERRRLLDWMQRGPLSPEDVWHLMRGLDTGYAEGRRREIGPERPLPRAAEGLRPYPSKPEAGSELLTGRIWQAAALDRRATSARQIGKRVTLFRFSPTALYHRVRFTGDGVWLQTGGVFGRSDRSDPLFRVTTLARRSKRERARLAALRGLGDDG